MLYFYHRYFRIQHNCYSKNYLLLLVYYNFLLLHSQKAFLIYLSIISQIAFSVSSLNTFLISLSILSLMALFSFSSLKRFLMSLIMVSIVSFFSFSSLKRFLTSLCFLLQAVDFPSLYVVKKVNNYLENKSLLHPGFL